MVANLQGTIAIVTGGGRGIGRAAAIALAGAGAGVTVIARTQNEIEETCAIIKSSGGVAQAVRADVTRKDEVHSAVQAAKSLGGPVNLLVNNAGAGRSIGPIWNADADEWWGDFEVNVRGVFLCSQAVLPEMVEARRGRIINISSAAGNMTLPMTTSYACSKAAVQRFTDCLAASGKNYGVSIFAMSPGPTRTALTNHLLESNEGKKWMPEFQRMPAHLWTPLEKVGDAVCALASGKADALSGRFIHLKDNLDALIERAEQIQRDDLYTLRLRE